MMEFWKISNNYFREKLYKGIHCLDLELPLIVCLFTIHSGLFPRFLILPSLKVKDEDFIYLLDIERNNFSSERKKKKEGKLLFSLSSMTNSQDTHKFTQFTLIPHQYQ